MSESRINDDELKLKAEYEYKLRDFLSVTNKNEIVYRTRAAAIPEKF